jgi:hypothetical protein
MDIQAVHAEKCSEQKKHKRHDSRVNISDGREYVLGPAYIYKLKQHNSYSADGYCPGTELPGRNSGRFVCQIKLL